MSYLKEKMLGLGSVREAFPVISQKLNYKRTNSTNSISFSDLLYVLPIIYTPDINTSLSIYCSACLVHADVLNVINSKNKI